jgi:hypothetical protein
MCNRNQLLLFLLLSVFQLAAKTPALEVFTADSLVGEERIASLDYKPVEVDVPSFDRGSSIYYFKVKLSEETSIEDHYFLLSYALLDTVSFYQESSSGELSLVRHTGQALPFSTRQYPTSDFVFPIDPDCRTYYFKVISAKPMVFPLQVMQQQSLVELLTNNDFFFGSYVGIILVMTLYNLMVFFITRDKSYLFYVAYLVTLGIAQGALFGYTDRFLFPESPVFSSSLTVLSGAVVGITSVFFIINFLSLRRKDPLYFKLLMGVVVADVIGIVLLYSGLEAVAYRLVNGVALIGSILAIIAGLRLARKGYKPANFFLLAWTIFLISVVIFALKDYNILPYNPYFRRSMLFGSTIEIILLSIALADRINQLRREKDRSRAEALAMSKENERIIKEQNILLENKVNERTMELQETNEELQVTLDNLKDTQTQLVDAEKMASLGQLTAGIAHEINNPINFITSNIQPLRLDLKDLYEIIAAFQNLPENCSSGVLNKARGLLEELDYEFLKEEVESLVQGINDGADRTAEIVRGLRTFSRLDEDVVKKANLGEGLDSTLILLRNKTKDQIEVVKEYDPNLRDIDCFPGKLNQAFMNIINNAIYAVNKKNYAEGERPTITLRALSVDAEHAAVHIEDNGIGMDEATKKKIFEPFFTTKDVGEGTGLGMSIVFKIVDKHGGKVEVESEKGKGTNFIIILPKEQPNEFA